MCTYIFFIMVLANKLQVIGISSLSHSNVSILTPAGHNQSPLPKYNYLVIIVNPKRSQNLRCSHYKLSRNFCPWKI